MSGMHLRFQTALATTCSFDRRRASLLLARQRNENLDVLLVVVCVGDGIPPVNDKVHKKHIFERERERERDVRMSS